MSNTDKRILRRRSSHNYEMDNDNININNENQSGGGIEIEEKLRQQNLSRSSSTSSTSTSHKKSTEYTNSNSNTHDDDVVNNPEKKDKNTSFKSWTKKKFDEWDPSLKLKNTASVARDHLANERTFLAWLRTSLSFISIGVAITQLFRLTSIDKSHGGDKLGKPLGISFIILGSVFLTFGIYRYFHSQYLMTCGQFPASRGSVIIGTILTMLCLVACFVTIGFIESS
ncbi:hypothetical protein Glove_9g281 [Diversispora epigaea]|uniref:DUF202 domain-containing protein n=1 Tax=Diversispora epigaea TaxID=1348612 RepID=A0A397JV29_9GLOM|nr:hypothetical protein Glove_9g281 [Diversispora epigaea]